MNKLKSKLCKYLNHIPLLFGAFLLCFLFTESAYAETSFLDAFNLSYFIPLVLETMMNVAISLYKYFVGNGNGLVYLFIYIFLGVCRWNSNL